MPRFPDELSACTGFQWDEGKAEKNWEQRQVSTGESEEIFFLRPLLVATALGDSRSESRFAVLGRTAMGRRLTVILTIRGTLVRVISARDMSRKERRIYAEKG